MRLQISVIGRYNRQYCLILQRRDDFDEFNSQSLLIFLIIMQEEERQGHSQKSKISKDLQKLMQDFDQVDKNLSVQSVPDKVILLLGQTKAGKTTLMYYLVGKKLIRWYNAEIGLFQMKPEARIFNARIGNDYNSETVYPNIPTELGEDKALIIDMPGFSDTRYICRLLNIYIIREVIKKIRSVHVSLVIPNETLEASFLASIIERNCLLLNHRLVATPGCISFILTKVEDTQGDLDTFKEFMEVLREEREGDALGEAIKTLLGARIYMFENTEPQIEAGVALKAQIVAENRFFQTDEKPDNLLSESYADIISGQQDPLEFCSFVSELLDALNETLSHLIAAFTAAVQLHHLQDFSLVSVRPGLDEQELVDGILAHARQINVAGISDIEIQLNQTHKKPSQEQRLLSLVKKFYRPQRDELTMDLQIFGGELENFMEWSRLLADEESRVSTKMRRSMCEVFKFCSKVSRTISHIKQPDIISKFEAFSHSEDILRAIEEYKRIDGEGGLVVAIAQSELGAHMTEMEEFKQILFERQPNFKVGEFEEVVESRKVAARDRIKHKKMWEALETTKQVEPSSHKHHDAKSISINEISRDTISTIRSMPLESAYLKTLFNLLSKFKLQFEKATDETKTEFGMALFRQAGKLLEKLELFEEGVLFFLALPAETEAESLIRSGLDFGGLSQGFIRSILLPYYSRWNPNFLMVEALCNYLTLSVFDPAALYTNEQQLAALLQDMHNIDYEKLPFLKRFEFGLIERIYTDETYKSYILERARHNEERLSKSRMPNMSRELGTMKIV